jgi:DNA-binding SARP family transcriptional activator
MLGLRERLRELVLQTLYTLSTYHLTRREYAAGLDYITRLLALDSWREEAYRQLMLLLARNGQHNAALAQYQTCYRILAEELGVEPMAETTALYKRIQAMPATPAVNLPPPTNPFFGSNGRDGTNNPPAGRPGLQIADFSGARRSG